MARLAGSAGEGARRWSSPILLSLLASGAVAPLLTSGVGGAAVVSAGVGAVTAVGGNVLTDVVKAGVARVGDGGGSAPPSQEELAAELERGIRQILEAGGERADGLRAEIAEILRAVGAVGVAIEAAVESGDRELQTRLAEGLATVGRDFSEFGFVLSDVHEQLESVGRGIEDQSGQLREQSVRLQAAVDLGYRQTADIRRLLQLVTAIEQQTRPGRQAPPDREGRADPGPGGCPYRGLVAFGETDAGIFYGREEDTARVVARLARRLTGPGMMVVTGASGAGKSSLLRAGVLPAIARGELSPEVAEWPRRVLAQPTRTPLVQLAMVLAGLAGVDVATVLDRLTAQPERAHLLVRQAVETDARRRGLPETAVSGARLVLLVDQFEEIFTLDDVLERSGQEQRHDHDGAAAERAAFITALHAAATTPVGPGGAPAALVVAVVRGDFIDRCAEYPELAEVLRDGAYVLGPMSGGNLRRAVTGPADAVGLEIEPGLIDAIFSEVRSARGGYTAGVLPLLSQAMLTVWEHREGDRLTSRGYARTGGVNRAVATSAEEAFGSLEPADQDLAQRIFRQLTAVSGEGPLTRRAAGRPALDEGRTPDERAGIGRALDAFALRRLIVVDDTGVQIAHEVLLHAWPRLRGWLEADLAGHALYHQLLEATREWDAHQRASSYLFRGERLAAVRHAEARWRSDPGRHPALPPAGREFLDVSIHAQTRTRRRIRAVALMLVAATALSLTATGWAVSSQRKATEQRDIAAARQLAAQSRQSSGTDPVKAAQLAVAAQSVRKTPEGWAALRNVLGQAARDVLNGYQGEPVTLASDLKGHLLAIGNNDGTVALWDVRKHRQQGVVQAFNAPERIVVALSPDGRTLAAAESTDSKSKIRFWNVQPLKELGGLPISSKLESMAFTSDGQGLAVDDGKGVGLWKMRTAKSDGYGSPAPGNYIPYTKTYLTQVAIAADATAAAISKKSSNGSTLKLFDLTAGGNGKEVEIEGHVVALSPRGGRYAVTVRSDSNGAYAYIRDLHARKPALPNSIPLGGYPDDSKVGPFSADGESVVIDNKLWDVASGELVGPIDMGVWTSSRVASFVGEDAVASIDVGVGQPKIRLWNIRTHQPWKHPKHLMVGLYTFGLDGRTVISGTKESEQVLLQLWDVIGRSKDELTNPKPGNTQCGYPYAATVDKKIFALGCGDRRIEIWKLDAGTGDRFVLDSGLDGTITKAAFSPDGHTLATVTQEKGKVQLWDVDNRTLKNESPLSKPDQAVRALAFTADSKALVVGFGKTLKTYDVSDGDEIRSPDNIPSGGVTALAFSPDGRTLAIGGKKTIILWDTRKWRQKGLPITGHAGMVISMAFSPDGSTLASGDDGGTLPDELAEGAQVKLWDTATQSQIGATLASVGDVEFLAFPDSNSLVTGEDNESDDSLTVGHWNIAVPRDPEAAACAIAGSPLSRDEWRQYVPAGVGYRDICARR
ncbi:hypothetical protein ABZ806_06810 [Spirillospora sp. NPDC047418]